MTQNLYITGNPQFCCFACATSESRDYFISEMNWSGFGISDLIDESPPEWSWLMPAKVGCFCKS